MAISMFLKYSSYFMVTLQVVHLTLGYKYSPLPQRPLPLSLKASDVNLDHVTLPHDVTVIAYHDIIESTASGNSSREFSNLDVTLQNFVDQMTYLEVNGYHTITVPELYAYLTGNTVLPPRSVLLTFQGARNAVWTYAYPILREKKFYAAIFVSPDKIATARSTSEGPYMTLQQLKVIDNEPLFEIYPSGKSGRRLTEQDITTDTLREEIGGSKRWLEQKLGGSRPYFAWPQGAFNRATLRRVRQFYNMSFALDVRSDSQPEGNRLHQVPRFNPQGHQSLPQFVKALQEQQANLEEYVVNKQVSHCFDLDVEVQGHELTQALQWGFVPCSDVMFHANRLVTSQQLASLCVSIKKGLGLDGKDLETSSDVVTSSMVTRAGVVVSLYRCAKDAWLDFTQELPKVEIMNPFSDIDGSAYNGIVVAMAGLCDVAASPNDRGDAFHPSDWSSRGNAVVASWRMLGCLRDLISPSGEFPNDFQSENGVWKWLPSDTLPKAKDSASIAVAASADAVASKFHVLIPATLLFIISFIILN